MHVHFEIYHGLLHQSSLHFDYQDELVPALPLSSKDGVWRNRIVWLCARILQWVERGSGSITLWQQLKTAVDGWESQRPASFDAFSQSQDDWHASRYFPQLWFTEGCHGESAR